MKKTGQYVYEYCNTSDGEHYFQLGIFEGLDELAKSVALCDLVNEDVTENIDDGDYEQISVYQMPLNKWESHWKASLIIERKREWNNALGKYNPWETTSVIGSLAEDFKRLMKHLRYNGIPGMVKIVKKVKK